MLISSAFPSVTPHCCWVIAQAVSALDGLSPQQTSSSAPPSARTPSHSSRFGGASDRPLALARTLRFLLLWVFSGLVSQCLWFYKEAPWQRRVTTAVLRATRLWCSVVDGIRPRVSLQSLSRRSPPVSSSASIFTVPARRPACCLPVAPTPFAPCQLLAGQRYLQEAQQLGIPVAAMASPSAVVTTAE